jgi:hypothetical protein
MSETGDGVRAARVWLAQLQQPAAATVAAETFAPPAASSLAALAAVALVHRRSLLLVTADDQPLPDISNALDLDLRPLCLVLPAADYALRIALRATLSLLKSRLTRAGDDAEGPMWLAQRQRLERQSSLWRACLAWSARDLDGEPWPVGLEGLFPVRILPLALARRLAVASDWVVLVDASRLPEDACRPWPDAQRTLLLEAIDTPRRQAFSPPIDAAGRCRAELDVLAQELAELELELATAQAEIADFTRRYHVLIGSRISLLDALQARLAERRAAAAPGDPAARREAETARQRADHSRRERAHFADVAQNAARPFAPTGDLKKLYRQLAQKIHPDRARDEDDRTWRTQLMAEANRAYQAGDEAALREVLTLWQVDSRRGTATARDMDDLDTQVLRLKRRIAAIEGELNRLFGSRLYELFTAHNIGRRAGRDLLAEMAAKLDADIAVARSALSKAA